MLVKERYKRRGMRPLPACIIIACVSLGFLAWTLLLFFRYVKGLYPEQLEHRALLRIPASSSLTTFHSASVPAVRFSNAPTGNHTKMVIAMYFPQFHEFEVNNRLWGKGYTDFAGVRTQRVARFDYPVCRPLDGYYDLRNINVRKQHGRLARHYGVHGFAYYHYWFEGGPIMDAPLEALLSDGEPDLPFMLAWANEDWTKRWDGGATGTEGMLMKQTYKEEDWRPHFDWLLRFFKHPNYILRDGRPVVLIYRIHEVAGSERMLSLWRQWASEAGFARGLYIVQMNGHKWSETALQVSALADGAMEFYPNFYNVMGGVSIRPMDDLLSTRAEDAGLAPQNYFFGVHASFNNKPRHATDGNERLLPYHPVALKFALKQQLARSPPGAFVFVNAWNEWGEGVVLEPSVEFGYSWLDAIREAVADEVAGAPLFSVPRAGLPEAESRGHDQNVCILVRTFQLHSSGFFTLERMLRSLQQLEHKQWTAFVMDSNLEPFDGLESIVAATGDPRIVAVSVPPEHRVPYDPVTSAYASVDAMLKRHCLDPAAAFDAFLVTNGDNFYAPDALNLLPVESDMVFMNFHSCVLSRLSPPVLKRPRRTLTSPHVTALTTLTARRRYALANSLSLTGAGVTQCCTRLASYTCTAAQPQIGLIDLGAIVVRRASWDAAGLTFSQFTGACAVSCHDGALAQHVHQRLGWRIDYHPLGTCALLHNPNPVACRLVGGVYYDAADWREAGCFDVAALPIPLGSVDWVKFLQPGGCVCKRLEV